jgi:cell division protein FtsX
MGEIAVRMALGASRRRIVLQMFIEALVLAVLAAVVGVAILLWPLGRFQAVFDTAIAQGDGLPVWFDVGLGWHTMLTVMALTLLSAVLTGALPALKLTSRRVQAQLQRSQPGSSGLTFGRTTTLIVVSQVALSVALLTVGGAQLRSIVDDWSFGDDGGRSREQLLRADLRWDLGPDGEARNDTRALLARAEARREFARRAETELDVAGATFESFQGIRYFSPDTGAAAGALLPFTYTTAVESNYFDVQGVPLRAGRALAAGDWLDTAAPVAVVNHAFVDAMSLDGDPVGRHIRQIDPRTRQASGDSIRIVGVAEDIRALEVSQQGPSWIARPTVYLPLSDTAAFVRTVIRARGDPGRLAGSLQALAADIDPTLLVHRVRTFVDDDRFALTMAGLYGIAVGFFVFAALLLSTTGVYAMMSFTATQRTREIGIRTALGAPAARIVGAIFARAMTQLGLGTIIGLGIGYLAADGPFALSRGLFTDGPGVALGVAALIIAMGLVACGRPMRRALSIEPTVALRADG